MKYIGLGLYVLGYLVGIVLTFCVFACALFVGIMLPIMFLAFKVSLWTLAVTIPLVVVLFVALMGWLDDHENTWVHRLVWALTWFDRR